MTRTRKWIAGTAVLALLIMTGGWLLLIAPQRAEAAELRDAAASQRSANATMQVSLDELVAKAADLPALQARLDAVRARLPSEAQLPDLIRSLTDGAGGAGMVLTGIVPSTPQLVTAAGVQVAPDPAAPAALAGEQLYAINVSMTLTGAYAGVSSYINQLEELTRVFQVTGFTLGQDTGDGAVPGSILLSVQGRAFVLSSLTPDVSVPVTVDPIPGAAPADTVPTAPAETVPTAPAVPVPTAPAAPAPAVPSPAAPAPTAPAGPLPTAPAIAY